MILKKVRKAVRKLMNPIDSIDRLSKSKIDDSCIGYSTDIHWTFFQRVLRKPDVKNVCVLGVYFGRDIGYMATILRRHKRSEWCITGVDKFEDSAGADWPEEKRGLKWKEAGFGPAPSLQDARACLTKAGVAGEVKLLSDTAQNFLKNSQERFDFIYIDIAHDYESTRDTIRLAIPRLKDGGIIAGDDFSNEGTWGVARAVEEAFSKFALHRQYVWSASKSDYRGAMT